MVVNDLHFVGVALTPLKADTPLDIDTDAVLAFSFPRQVFEVV